MVFFLEKANSQSLKLLLWHFEDTEYGMSSSRFTTGDSSRRWKVSIQCLRGYSEDASGLALFSTRATNLQAESQAQQQTIFLQTGLSSCTRARCWYASRQLSTPLGKFRRAFRDGLPLLEVTQDKVKTVWSGITAGLLLPERPLIRTSNPDYRNTKTKGYGFGSWDAMWLSEWMSGFWSGEVPSYSEGGSGMHHAIQSKLAITV